MLDLEKIRKRWSEVTPGPWGTRRDGAYSHVVGSTTGYFGGEIEIALDVDHDDAEAIAAAPTDIAALVEEVERLRYALREIADSLSHDDLEGAQDTCGAFADLIESGSGADHE